MVDKWNKIESDKFCIDSDTKINKSNLCDWGMRIQNT